MRINDLVQVDFHCRKSIVFYEHLPTNFQFQFPSLQNFVKKSVLVGTVFLKFPILFISIYLLLRACVIFVEINIKNLHEGGFISSAIIYIVLDTYLLPKSVLVIIL